MIREIEVGERCGFCEKKIRVVKGKLLFYSHHLTEYFCDQHCMDSRYADYMGTQLIDVTK